MERILSNSRVSGEVVGSITLNLAMQVCVDNHDAATALSLFALMKDQVLANKIARRTCILYRPWNGVWLPP